MISYSALAARAKRKGVTVTTKSGQYTLTDNGNGATIATVPATLATSLPMLEEAINWVDKP